MEAAGDEVGDRYDMSWNVAADMPPYMYHFDGMEEEFGQYLHPDSVFFAPDGQFIPQNLQQQQFQQQQHVHQPTTQTSNDLSRNFSDMPPYFFHFDGMDEDFGQFVPQDPSVYFSDGQLLNPPMDIPSNDVYPSTDDMYMSSGDQIMPIEELEPLPPPVEQRVKTGRPGRPKGSKSAKPKAPKKPRVPKQPKSENHVFKPKVKAPRVHRPLPVPQPREVVDSTAEEAELRSFSVEFKRRRLEYGFSQSDVGLSVGRRFGTDFSQTTISRFEAFNLSVKNMQKLRPMLESWIEQARASHDNGFNAKQFLECDEAAGEERARVAKLEAMVGCRHHHIALDFRHMIPSYEGNGDQSASNDSRPITSSSSTENGSESGDCREVNPDYDPVLYSQFMERIPPSLPSSIIATNSSSLMEEHSYIPQQQSHQPSQQNALMLQTNRASSFCPFQREPVYIGRRRRRRTVLDDIQREQLITIFNQTPNPDQQRITEVAEDLHLESFVVRVWFANRRQHVRRQRQHKSVGCNLTDAIPLSNTSRHSIDDKVEVLNLHQLPPPPTPPILSPLHESDLIIQHDDLSNTSSLEFV